MQEILKDNKITPSAEGPSEKLRGLRQTLRRILLFSPADDTLAPGKNLSVSIEKGKITVSYGSRFFSKIRVAGTREFLFNQGKYPQPGELASSLALAVHEFGVKPADITLSIPKEWAVIRTAEFPSTIKENIADAVTYEMDRLTPFSAEDVLFDFRVTGDSGERLTLMIMAVKRDRMAPYLDAVRETGLNPAGITVNLPCMDTLCRHLEKTSDIIYIETDRNGYQGTLSIGNSLRSVFSGSFSRDDETSNAGIVSEDINSIMEKHGSPGRAPGIVALVKDHGPSFTSALKSQLRSDIRVIGSKDSTGHSGAEPVFPFTTASGALLQSLKPGDDSFNLLSKGRREKQKVPMALTSVLLFALAVTIVFSFITPFRIEKKRLAAVNSMINEKTAEFQDVSALNKEADALNAETAFIDGFRDNRTMTINIIKELTSALPDTAWLKRIRLDAKSSLQIEGYAASPAELLPRLEASEYFEKVQFSTPTIRDTRMNTNKFSIKMELASAGQHGVKEGHEK